MSKELFISLWLVVTIFLGILLMVADTSNTERFKPIRIELRNEWVTT